MKPPKLSRLLLGLAALALLCACLLLRLPPKPEEASEYVGILRVWDKEALTVSGSKFAFIETVCQEFSELGRTFALLKCISAVESEQNYAAVLEAQNADVICARLGELSVPTERLLNDPELSLELSGQCEEYIVPNAGAGLIVDVYANVSVLLVNTDILASLKISLPEKLGKAEFLELLAEIKAKNSDEELTVLSVISDADSPLLPLMFGFAEGSTDADRLSFAHEVESYLSDPPADEQSFYAARSALLLGDLRSVNYLLRREMGGREVFGYEQLAMPSDTESYLYICDIASYAFFDCADEAKKEALRTFARYLHSYEVMRYTENLGMLPAVRHEEMKYSRYPHLVPLLEQEGSWMNCRDEQTARLRELLEKNAAVSY